MKFDFTIAELRKLKASQATPAEAILSAIEDKVESTMLGRARDTVASVLASAEKAISTKKDN